jgi:two-component system, chemotaxis family, sensor histidine kinase and response regulator WspE
VSGFSLYGMFQDELTRIVAELAQQLIALVADPTERSRVEQVSRKLHALKGAARVTHLPGLEKLLSAMEQGPAAVRRGEIELGARAVNELLAANEVLQELSQQEEAQVASWLAAQSARMLALQKQLIELAKGDAPQSAASASNDAERKMLELFDSEAQEQVASLHRSLMLLEVQPDQLGLIAPIMRAAHSIKGAARAVRLERTVALAHVMEDRLSAMQRGELAVGEAVIELLMQASDTIAEQARIAKAQGQEVPNTKLEALIARLEALSSEHSDAPGEPFVRAARQYPSPEIAPHETEPTPIAVQTTDKLAAAADSVSAEPLAAAKAGSYIPVANLDAVLKVHASKISELIGMAGQGVVESRKLRPYGDRLQRLRRDGVMLSELIDDLHHELGAPPVTDPIGQRIGELRKRISEVRRTMGAWSEEFGEFARESDNLNQRIYRAASATRMRPFRDSLLAFPRMARDLAKRLGKRVTLQQVGTHVDVDRDMLERIEAPLTHLLRNALDHGIEMPSVRRAKGKPEEGTIRISADHRAGMLAVDFYDDGAGIDAEKLRLKVVAKGLLSKEAAAVLEHSALFAYLFQPGFSTADKVTEISGRGVGLDVVRDLVQQVNGTFRVQSKVGESTTFHLLVPISRSVTRAIVVLVNGETYAFPVTRVHRIAQIHVSAVSQSEGRQFVELEKRNISLVDLAQVLELGQALPDNDEICIVVVERQAQLYGFAVDRFLGEFDLAARTLDVRLGQVADLAGAALMPDGEPVLILDMDDLLRTAARRERSIKIALSDRPVMQNKRKRVLVVDDSISVRELERQLLVTNGYEVSVAVDGVDGWGQVRDQEFDLVVTDVDMPRMDGIQLTRSIKQDPRLRNLPVIIVSYRDRPEDRSRGMDARADCYLTKGDFHDRTFLQNVVDLIGEANS